MKPGLASTGDRFSVKAFNRGLLAVFLVYFLLFGWVFVNERSSLSALHDRMPARTVGIERPAPAPIAEPISEPVSEAYVFPPAPAAVHNAEAADAAQEVMQEAGEGVEAEPAEPMPSIAQDKNVVVPPGPLEAAPIEDLYENAADGKLPRVSASGLTPFDAYKRPFLYQGQPVIVLAVRDYGLSASASELALALPPDVTLILSPYAENPEAWQRKAREAGHEIWIGLPMENTRFLREDPGPQALLVHSSMPENQRKLNWVLSRATGYAGVAAETDKAFLDMHSMLGALLTSVFKRGLGYLELNTNGSEFIETLAVANASPFTAQKESIVSVTDNDLTRLESLARGDGFVIATVDLTPHNIENIRTWAMTLRAKGVSLAPVSAVAATKVQSDDGAPQQAP